jgi:HEAT repeat protein
MEAELPEEFRRSVDRAKPSHREYVRRALSEAMASGLSSYDSLLTALSDPSLERHWAGLWALAHMDRRRAAPTLVKRLRHPDPNQRREAAVGLGRLGGERAFESLVRAMNEDPEAGVREQAAHSLSHYF